MKYEDLPELGRTVILARLAAGSNSETAQAILSAALFDDDWKWAQDICIKHSTHENANVRGSAILGLGHIARIHRKLENAPVIQAIKSGLNDVDEFVL